MKKSITIGSLIILAALFLSGCGRKTTNQNNSSRQSTMEDAETPEPQKNNNLDCAEKGENINWPADTNKNLPNICCDGLKPLRAFIVNESGECEPLIGGPFLTCTPCGNKVCESDEIEENKCNCHEDCSGGEETTEEEKFCAKNSGEVGELTECGKKVKTCVLDDGTVCPLDAFFDGECKKGVIVEWGEQCR